MRSLHILFSQYFVSLLTCLCSPEAVQLLVKWVHEQKVPGLQLEVVKEKGRTPLIFIEVPATGKTDQLCRLPACRVLHALFIFLVPPFIKIRNV